MIKYDFDILYVEKDSKIPPICEDLAICKINDELEEIKIDKFLNENNLPNEVLSFSGYSKRIYPSQIEKKICINRNESLNLYVYKAQDEKLNEARRKIGVSGKNEISDTRALCENVRSLRLNKDCSGLSGGPIFKGSNIYGLLISADYILSAYIIKKLNQLRIHYKSN